MTLSSLIRVLTIPWGPKQENFLLILMSSLVPDHCATSCLFMSPDGKDEPLLDAKRMLSSVRTSAPLVVVLGKRRGGRHRKRWGSKNAVISAHHLETGIIPNNHLMYGSATRVSESNRLLVTNASGCQVGLLNSQSKPFTDSKFAFQNNFSTRQKKRE